MCVCLWGQCDAVPVLELGFFPREGRVGGGGGGGKEDKVGRKEGREGGRKGGREGLIAMQV